jgi:hypothetical protein
MIIVCILPGGGDGIRRDRKSHGQPKRLAFRTTSRVGTAVYECVRDRKRTQTIAMALAVLVSVVCIVSSAIATPLPRTIAPVRAEVPISAGGGWLLWSVPVGTTWGLDAYHDGTIQALPVARRPQPFDVNVGTDAHGKPVATFSRCSKTPRSTSETPSRIVRAVSRPPTACPAWRGLACGRPRPPLCRPRCAWETTR